MLGRKHSLNVASAGAVVLYELLRKYKALSSQPSAVSPESMFGGLS
jgi:tRNA C32,U32 (ribose-2'-O)-methylase TrmJ